MSAPSSSLWSAFSVRPPSAIRSSVSPTVSKRNASASAVRSAAGSVRDRRRVGRAAAPERVGDLPRAVGGLALRDHPRLELGRGHARQAGAFVVGHGSMLAQPGQRPVTACRRSPAGRAGTRRPRHRLAAGGLDLVEPQDARPAVASADRAVEGRPAPRRAAGPADARHDDDAAVARSRGTSRATAGRRGPGAPARAAGRAGSSRPSSRRNGLVRVAPSAVLRRAAEIAPEPRPERRASSSAPRGQAVASSSGRRLVARRAATRSWATIGPVSMPSSMRMSETPVRASPARIVGRDRASRRGGAAAATDAG